MSVKFRSIPTKTLSQNLSSADVLLYLNNTLDWDGSQLSSADFGTQLFALLRNASNTQIELFELNPATVTADSTITILKRGLGYDGAQVDSAQTKYNWNAFDTYVELGADTPQMLQYLKDYLDGVAVAGTVDATSSVKGVVELATQAEVDAGTATGATGASLVATPATTRGKLINDYAADAGSTDAYAVTISPALTAYVAGQQFTFKANTANTGAATLNVSALGAKTIKKNYNEDLATGDILANQIITVIYDGTNMQVLSKLPATSPTVQVFTANAAVGSSTTRFDIINTVGSTYRYTFDGTGTDPSFSLANYPVGTVVDLQGQNFAAGNKGLFVTTAAGLNYIEVTNASGVAENDKTIGTGYITKGAVWTKPTGLKYVVVELVGGGCGGGDTTVVTGSRTTFGAHLSATGGSPTSGGGVGSNGNINITGTAFQWSYWYNNGSAARDHGGIPSMLGSYGMGGGVNQAQSGSPSTGSAGGYSKKTINTTSLGTTESIAVGLGTSGNGAGKAGGAGVIIVTEYYS